MAFIESNRGDGKPFFAYLSYTAPHDPLHAPAEYIEKYEGRFDEGWDVLRAQRRAELLEAWQRYSEQNEVFDHKGRFDAAYRKAYGAGD